MPRPRPSNLQDREQDQDSEDTVSSWDSGSRLASLVCIYVQCLQSNCQFFCCFVTVYSVELTMGSPSPSNSTPPSSLSNSSESDLNCCESLTRCGACGGPLVLPKVLTCFHAFCRPCLERIEESRRITCPSCHVETYLSAEGVSGLLPYFGPSGTAIKDN